jgi:hypothetical protein
MSTEYLAVSKLNLSLLLNGFLLFGFALCVFKQDSARLTRLERPDTVSSAPLEMRVWESLQLYRLVWHCFRSLGLYALEGYARHIS